MQVTVPGDAPVALIANARSRHIRRRPELLDALSSAHGSRGPFLASREPGELPLFMRRLRDGGCGLIIVCGGDGTIRQTITHLIREYGRDGLPPIALLRGGTMNTTARSLRVCGSPLAGLRRILQTRTLDVVPVAPLRFGDEFGFIAALGGFCNFIARYAEVPDPTPWRGFHMTARVSASVLLGTSTARGIFPPFRARILRDGERIGGGESFVSVCVSALRQIGFGFSPFMDVDAEEGKFGVLIFRRIVPKTALSLPRFFLGLPVRGEWIVQEPARQLVVSLDEPLDLMVDGDILPPLREVTIASGPVLSVAVPRY